MKLTITNVGLIAVLSAGLASASTISVGSEGLIELTTDPLNPTTLTNASGFVSKVGVYSGPALTTTATFADINAGFTQVGSDIAFATAAASGYNGFFATDAAIVFNDAAGVANQNVWLWVTDGADLNFVVEATGAGVGDQTFKADDAVPNSGSVQFGGPASLSDWSVRLGGFTTEGVNAAYGGSYILNNAVPEPSVALLGAFGVMGLLRRRRA